MSGHLALSHPPHKNRSPMRAGPCPPASQAPTHIRHIETWAGRQASGDTSTVGISDLGAQLPNLASAVNGKCSLGKLCITITWIQSGLAAAAAAKSLQLCPTLCDPIDGSPPGSPVPGILQARTLEWLAISFSNA